jgi:hypothetical protein
MSYFRGGLTENTSESKDHQEAMKRSTQEAQQVWKTKDQDQYNRWMTSEQKLPNAYRQINAAIVSVHGVAR